MNIGPKLKELRLSNDLTLEELANRCGLTKGFLSQVERDLTSPNVVALENILEALGSNLGEFFQTTNEEQIVFRTQDYFVNEKPDQKIEWVIPNAQKNEMEPIILTLKPNARSELMKAYSGEEFGYVLKGKVLLVRGNKNYHLKAKESFYLSANISHYLYNEGTNDAKILWVSTPPMF